MGNHRCDPMRCNQYEEQQTLVCKEWLASVCDTLDAHERREVEYLDVTHKLEAKLSEFEKMRERGRRMSGGYCADRECKEKIQSSGASSEDAGAKLESVMKIVAIQIELRKHREACDPCLHGGHCDIFWRTWRDTSDAIAEFTKEK